VEAVICVTPKGGNNWTIEVAKQTSDQVVMWRTGVSGYILVREGFGDGYRIFYITPA
jgi:hypothetical protein